MSVIRGVTVLAFSLGVTACGGDGSSSGSSPVVVAPTPPPPPGPPPPAPRPTAITLETLPDEITLTSFTASTSYYRRNVTGEVFSFNPTGVGIGQAVSYNRAGGLLFLLPPVFTGGGLPPVPVARYERDGRASNASFDVSRFAANGYTFGLRQLKVGRGNPTAGLVYTSFARSDLSYNDKGTLIRYTSVLGFGLPFDYDATKLTGNATYTGVVEGTATANGVNHVYDVTGTFAFDVNYGSGAFTARVTLMGVDDVSKRRFDFGTIDIPLDRGLGLGGLSASGPSALRFQVLLAGEQAQEVFGGLSVERPDPQAPGTQLSFSVVLVGRK